MLREKYEKTYTENTEVMIDKIMALMKVEESESGEKTWDKFYRLVSEFEKMNLNEHPRYMLGMIMIAGLEESKKITDEEKRFREAEYENKLEKASVVQNRVFNNVRYKEGDSVYYQEENKKSWKSPVKVLAHKRKRCVCFGKWQLKEGRRL